MTVYRSIILFVHATLPPEQVEFWAESWAKLAVMVGEETKSRRLFGWKVGDVLETAHEAGNEFLSV